MLTLDAAWKKAMRVANPEITYSVQVDIDGSTSFKMCSRPDAAIATTSGGEYVPIVSDVSPIAIEVDPVENKVKFGSRMDVVLVDEGTGSFIRNMLTGSRTKNKRIIIKWADASNAIGVFASFWRGFVNDWTIDGASVVLHCSDAWDQLSTRRFTGDTFSRKHPLEYAEDIIDAAGISSELKDTTALDPDTYTSSMSHWATARIDQHAGSNRTPQGTGGDQLLEELAQILDGAFYVDEDGKITFTEFDSSAAADANWTDDDIRDFRQISATENMFNKIRFQHSVFTDGTMGDEIQHSNTDEQGNYPYPGESNGIFEYVLLSPWVGVDGVLTEALETNGTSLKVGGGLTHSMTGMRDDGSSGWTLTSSRKAYYILQGADNSSLPATVSTEVVECTAAATDSTWTVIGPDGAISTYYNAATFTINTSGRDIFNGGASTGRRFEKDTIVTDITIPVEICRRRMERMSQGMPVVECETSLYHYDVQVGDTVTVTTDRFVGFGLDGLTTSQKWKVIRKEVTGGTIKWKLAFGGNTTGYTEDWSPKGQPIGVPRPPILPDVLLPGGVLYDPKIVFQADNLATNLDVSLGTGQVAGQFGTIFVQDISAVSLTASKDNYMFLDTMTGAVNVREETTGAGYPSIVPTTHMPLALAETSGSAVTALTDLRPPERVLRPPGQTITALPDVNTIDAGTLVEVGEELFKRRGTLYDELVLDTDGGDECLLYWKLDESSGTTADNAASSGATYDGTYTNSPTLGSDGIFPDDRTCMKTDAAQEGVVLTGLALTGATEISVAGWFQGEATSNIQFLFTVLDGASALDFCLASVAGLNTTMDFYVAGTKYDLTIDKEEFLTGAPVHVAATWDQTSEDLKVYLNGTLRDTIASVASGGSVDIDDIYLGTNGASTLGFGTSPTPGYMQNFAIWNTRLLTGTEIAAMADRGLGYHANWIPSTPVSSLDAEQVAELYVRADRSAYLGATSTTIVPLDRATVNRSGGFDASTGRYTIADDGVYLVHAQIVAAGLSTTKNLNTDIYKNAAVWRTGSRPIGNVSSSVEVGQVFAIGPLDAGDIIDFRVYNADSSAVDVKGGSNLAHLTRMCIWKLPVRGDNVHS